MASEPLDHVLTGRRVAVIGVAKNCGKTTTMNALVRRSLERRERTGLLSIGIDGETSDVLLGTPKPAVHVEKDQWVVTSSTAMESSSARMEFVDSLGFSTPLGEAILARVMEPGAVVLAGLRHSRDLKLALEMLESAGTERIFIDGAYGRISAAHSDISDAVVVSTGAVVGPDIQTIVGSTADLLDPLTIPLIEDAWKRGLMEAASREKRTLVGGAEIDPRPLPRDSALLGLPRAREMWTPEIEAIAIPGVVTDGVLEELLAVPKGGRSLLVHDPTTLCAEARILRRLQKSWRVETFRRARVTGISFNPTSIRGEGVDESRLRTALASRWPSLTVFNPRSA